MAAKKKKKVKKAAKPKRAKKVPAKKSRKAAKRPAKKAKKSVKAAARKAPAKKAKAKKAPAKKKTIGEGDYAASRSFLKDQSGFVAKNKSKKGCTIKHNLSRQQQCECAERHRVSTQCLSRFI